MSTDPRRDEAVASLKRKAGFKKAVLGYIAGGILLILIWLFSGRGYFWPVWPILGAGIAIVIAGWSTYRGPRSDEPSEAQIEREMQRLGDDSEQR